MFKKYLKFIIPFFVFCFFFSVNTYLAQGSIMGDLEKCDCNATYTAGSDCQKYCTGDYELNDFMKVFVNYYDIVLGLVGSLALLFFIYGGIVFLISGGNSEKVEQGKKILIGAAIGLVIVFASYTLIQFVFTALEIPGAGKGGWATPDWF